MHFSVNFEYVQIRVRLGSDDNTLEVRRVTYQDNRNLSKPRVWHYITDRFDLTPRQVVELYQYRWQIEIFIGWLKRNMQFGHWYSECENGVLIQLYAGLITFVLLKLYLALGAKTSFAALRIDELRWLQRHLFDPISQAEMAAYQQAVSTSLPLSLKLNLKAQCITNEYSTDS